MQETLTAILHSPHVQGFLSCTMAQQSHPVFCRRLPLLPPPPAGPSFVELQQRAERLAVEAAELEEESKLPEAAAGRAMKEGERLHGKLG